MPSADLQLAPVPELEKRDAGVKHSGFGGEAARMTSKAANPSKKRRKTENMTDEEKRERRCATFSCAQQLRYHAPAQL